MIKVLLVNETRLMCSVLGAVLRDEADIKVIGYATTAPEAIEKAKDADVVLLDANMPDDEAPSIAKDIYKQKNGAQVLVTGVKKSPETIVTYLESGASGYVLAEVGLDELLDSIRAVHEGEGVVEPEVVAKLIGRISELSDLCLDTEEILEKMDSLTPRELEVLECLSQGLTNEEIGEQLHIETGTVKNHVHNILEKLDVSSRHDAAKIANLANGELD